MGEGVKVIFLASVIIWMSNVVRIRGKRRRIRCLDILKPEDVSIAG